MRNHAKSSSFKVISSATAAISTIFSHLEPEDCIFAASPVNLLIGGRDDFYRETPKGYGARFFKILAENSLRPPKDLLDTTKDWTEVCYDAPSAAVVAVLRQGNSKRLNGLAKLFAEKHNLKLIDVIPD